MRQSGETGPKSATGEEVNETISAGDETRISAALREIEAIIAFDPGHRGVGTLVVPGSLESACRSLAEAKGVGIITGYYVPTAGAAEADGSSGACETDGPPGAWAIGQALAAMGVRVQYFTDKRCAGPMVAAGMSPLAIDAADDEVRGFSHLLSIERSARAADGRYYNSRAMDRSPTTGDLDRWFLNRVSPYVTIGIGDGGNEIGMGNVRDRVAESVPNGATIASIVPVDHLLVTGVSNWGGWAIAAGLSLLTGRLLLPDAEQAEAQLAAVVAGGAFDGIRGVGHGTVDNLEWDVHLDVLAQIHGAMLKHWRS